MRRMTFVLIIFVAIDCSSGTTSQRTPATAAQLRELALDLVRNRMTDETYRLLLVGFAQSIQQTMEKQAAAEGRKLPPDAISFISATVSEQYPFEETMGAEVDFFARHFSEGELRELAAFYRSPLHQKEMRLMVTQEGESQRQMTRRLIERRRMVDAKIAAHFGLKNPEGH